VKLYVCWGTFQTLRPGGHPCRNAHVALREAGWDPDVERVYGWGLLPDVMNPTRGQIRKLTGQNWVPVLVTDDDEVIQGSDKIAAWALDNPASGADRPA
jgi:Glutathione S-transferase, N-terminal domain